MTDPKITTLPAAPSRQQPANFAARSDALLGALAGFVTETNSVVDWARLRVDEVAASAALSNAAKAVAQEMIALAPTIESYQDNALAYKNATEAAAALTQGYKDDVASAIVYQSLQAILETKAETAVDVFIYDPSTDSDGGAWRDRYRGGFPALAVFVATQTGVTIYDATDPALPVWKPLPYGANMFPSNATITKVRAKDGGIYIGQNGQLSYVNLLSGKIGIFTTAGFRPFKGGFDQSGVALGYEATAISVASALVNGVVNALTLEVRPDAPIDHATRLPVTMVGVGTDGGASIMNGPAGVGITVDITHTTNNVVSDVRFDMAGGVTIVTDSTALLGRYAYSWFEIPTTDLVEGPGNIIGTADALFRSLASNVSGWTNNVTVGNTNKLDEGAIGNTGGLTLQVVDRAVPENTLQAQITTTSNTGWVLGQASAVLFCDTDTATLNGDLELGGDTGFDDPTFWDNTSSPNWVISGGAAFSPNGSGGYLAPDDYTSDPLPAGAYHVSVEFLQGTLVQVYDNNGNQGTIYATDPQVLVYVARGTSRLRFRAPGNEDLELAGYSIKPAAPDYSALPSQHMFVRGLVNRVPVATGAELTAYTGFSGTTGNPVNYIERPFDPALTYGPNDDFCIMGWVKATTSGILAEMGDGAGGEVWRMRVFGSDLRFDDMGVSPVPITLGRWVFVVFARKDGIATVYIDGVAVSSLANTVDFRTTDTLWFGGSRTLSTGTGSISLALWDFTPVTPSAEMVAKIYRDELRLFQPDSQAGLAGTSNAVVALARDEVTGLRHVGTSAGRSIFDGLVRVGETATPVTTAIAAHGGMIVEQ